VSDFVTPKGWPEPVEPPGKPGWEQSAVRWLYEHVPGEWREGRNGRQYPQNPIMLARDAHYLVGGQLEGLREAYRKARVELADHFQPEQIAEQLDMYKFEAARLTTLHQQVQLVYDALAGVRWVPRGDNLDWSKL